MGHAIPGFLDRLKLIVSVLGSMTVVAMAAIQIVRISLIGKFRQMDAAARIEYFIFGSVFAIMLSEFIWVVPTLMGYRSKAVKISEFIVIVLADIVLWLVLRHQYKKLSPEDQKEWKSIIPPNKWTRANWIMMGLYCIPLILNLCGVHAQWTVLELPLLFLIQAGVIIFKYRPRQEKTLVSDADPGTPSKL